MNRETFRRIAAEAACIGAMQEAAKADAMIYQLRDKVAAAKHFGLAFDQVDLPYPQWAAIRKRWVEETQGA